MTKEMKNVAAGNVVVDARTETLWVIEEKSGKFKTVMMHNRIDKAEVVTVTYATFKKHFTVLTNINTLKAEEPEVVETKKATGEKKVSKRETNKKVLEKRDVDFQRYLKNVLTRKKSRDFKGYDKVFGLYRLYATINGKKKVIARVKVQKDFYVLVKEEVAKKCKLEYQLIKYNLPAGAHIPEENIKEVLENIYNVVEA